MGLLLFWNGAGAAATRPPLLTLLGVGLIRMAWFVGMVMH